jgi:capsular exopolysaccharide synthesis family protein
MKTNIRNTSLNTKDTTVFQETISQYKKYWKWYLLSSFIFLALGVLYVKIKAPVFAVNANVLIKTEDNNSSAGTASLMKSIGGLGGMMSSESVEDEMLVMSSQTLTKQMVYNLKLFTKYDLVRFPFNKPLYGNSPIVMDIDRSIVDTLSAFLKFKISVDENKKLNIVLKVPRQDDEVFSFSSLPADIKTKYGVFKVRFSDTHPMKPPYKISLEVFGLDPAAEMYKQIIDISQVSRKSNMIQLTVNDENKPRGKDILNEIIRLYNIDALSDKNKNALSTNEFLRARTDTIYGELKAIEGNIEQYKVRNKLTDTQMEAGMAVGQITELQKKDVEFEIQKSLITSIDNLVKSGNSKDQLIPQSLVLSAEVNSAVEQYNGLILEKMRMLRNMNEQNPVIQALNDRISLVNKQVQSTLQHALKEITMVRKDWGSREGELMGRSSQIPRMEREYIDIKRQQGIKSEIYMFLLQKMEENQLTLAANAPKAKIVDEAFVLSKPVAPKKMIVLGGSLAFGFFFALGIVYILESLKTTVQSKDELERLADAEIIGEIAKGDPNQKIVVEGNSTNPGTELFRLLRGNLMFILNEPSKKVILVTSTIPGEGKTYVSSNLAVSLALTDRKVVLVGLDIRNPRLGENFKVAKRDGITNYLSESTCGYRDIVQPSGVHPDLDVILAGPIPPNPNELLLKNRLEELFASLRQEYDYIVVDSAPVGVVSDTFHLNRISDVCLYVSFIGKTKKESVRFANSIRSGNKLSNLYLIANGIDLKEKNGGYGYGYSRQNK